MKRLFKQAWVLVVILALCFGCATGPKTPTANYHDTLTTFNDLVESYEWHYQKLPLDKQEILKDEVDPLIEAASDALDFWGGNYDSPTAYQMYLNALRELQLKLIEHGLGGGNQ